MKQKIGEMNGGWAFLLKLTLVGQPFIIAWCVWVTNSVQEIKGDVRFINTTHGFTRERFDIHEKLPSHFESSRELERIKARLVILEKLTL